MYKTSTIVLFILLFIGFYAQAQQVKQPKRLSENEKIECLIISIEQLTDAQLYRNGSWYDATTAADHLRMKLSKAGSRVKTAQDFIDKVASCSSMTGEAYKIKYSNGIEVTTKEYFTEKLKELNSH
jgi:hypothetical protein